MLENRKYFIQFAIAAILVVYAFRLYHLQVADTSFQERASRKTTIEVVEYPQRGLIYDRNGELMVANVPVFNVKVVANDLVIPDTTLLARLLDLPEAELLTKLRAAYRGIRRYQPYLLKKQLNLREHARLQGRLADFEGIFVEATTIRRYPFDCFANGVGYVKEVDRRILQLDTTGYYRQGDLIGRSGLEQTYEQALRGVRGIKRYIRSARGVRKGIYGNQEAMREAEVGQDLVSTIDVHLQQYGEQLMRNKRGSVVAIEPQTGEILAMISAPSYDPNLLTGAGREVSRNFQRLLRDPDKPLFNRATMSAYPPGSTFKLLQALIGMQDSVLIPGQTSLSCTQEVVGCHGHPSPLSVHGSIQYSCNPFYLKAFKRIIKQNREVDERKDTRVGIQRWADYLRTFGLGAPLGVDINEKSGLIPDSTYYNRKFSHYYGPWRLSNVYSLSIGQGEISLTPLQMANVATIIANRGYYITPHLIRKIGGTDTLPASFREPQRTPIDARYFDIVAEAMVDVVRAGTARRARTPDITVCGKTGTVQNPHGEDHSVFLAFAPKENPRIAIAAYVENSGFGGTWAAPIVSLMIEKYLKGEVTQSYKEKRILEAVLIEPEEEEQEASSTSAQE